MKSRSFLLTLLLCLLTGCYSAQVELNYATKFPPTEKAEIFSDPSIIPWQYFEIGYVEVTGEEGAPKPKLLERLKEAAQQAGANALIRVYFYNKPRHENDLESYSEAAAKAAMIRYRVGQDGQYIPTPASTH